MAMMPVLVKTITKLIKNKDHLRLSPVRWELFYIQMQSYCRANKLPLPVMTDGVLTIQKKQVLRADSGISDSKVNITWAKKIVDVRTAEATAKKQKEVLTDGLREERQETERQVIR